MHYVLADGQHRAAMVVNAWPGSSSDNRANLTVFLDGMNDLQGVRLTVDGVSVANPDAGKCVPGRQPSGSSNFIPGVLSVGSAAQDEDTQAPGTWHWPERE